MPMEPLRMPGHDLATQRRIQNYTLWRSVSRLIKCGDTAEFKALVESNEVDPNLQDSDGTSLLHDAVRHRAEAIVRMLVEKDEVDVNIRDQRGRTPLWEVVSLAHKAVFELLLNSNRVDTAARDGNGRNPLWEAASQGHTAVVELLLSNDRVDPDVKDKNGRTPLWQAASWGHTAIVELLLGNDRVDPDARDENGQTPLFMATLLGHETVIELLLGNDRVDPDAKDKNGQTPLYAPALRGHETIVKLLIGNDRVDPGARDENGRTPLREAVSWGRTAIVELLLGNDRVDPDARDENGRTLLREAASWGHTAIVELLLGNDRVDPDAKDKNGQTPLCAAALRGHETIVELLLASGRVDPDAKDTRGLTPLAWASRTNKSARVAAMLLSTGKVDASSRDNLGVTPLMWSIESRNDEVEALLLNSGKLDEDLTPTPAGDIDCRHINHWIESCNAQHGKMCQPTPLEHKLPQQLPQWVIDISRGCLVPGSTISRYIALSYVWSQGWGNDMTSRPPDSLLLKRLKLSDFQTPGYLRETWNKLPNAVQEAVALVRKLGENYLWVDCLCIVQDDDEKTREQVNHMGDIYSGAYLTIISAASEGRLNRTAGTFSRYRVEEEVENLYDELYRSQWATRGWTFQEQMLSKRAIVFSQHYIFWECQQCAWSRDGPRPETTTSAGTCFTAPHYDKASSMLSCSYPDFDLYTELVSLYNSRDFTFPQDVLPAFSGVLSTLGPNFPCGFLYGLPRIYLDIALLWQPFRRTCRRVARDDDDDQGTMTPKTHLPSWSWCGWTCPVDPYHLRTRSSYFNKDSRGSQLPVWKTQKLVQWYSLPQDMQCQVPADRPLMSEDGASTSFSSPTPLSASQQYVSLPHDSWPFLSCQTSRISLHIKAVFYAYRPLPPGMYAKRGAGWASIFKLPLFAKGPSLHDACDLICLETHEGLSAGVLRHMEKTELKLGDAVELIAVSTGTINLTDIEGDGADKLYKLNMYSPVYAKTSEYLEVEKEMGLYGVEGSDGREYHFYNVLWVEREGEIAYRRAAGRVPKAIWDANCTPPTKIILG